MKPIKLISIVLCLMMVCQNSHAWLAGYSYRKKITIDKTNVAANLTAFPVYVKITADTDIGGHLQNSPNDIRFTDSTDTPLNFERSAYTSAAGAFTGHYFVAVNLLTASNVDIYIYYGKASDTDGSGDPWDANYVGVYHMEQTSGNITDSSGNGNTLTAINGPTYSQTGVINKCINLNNTQNESLQIASALVSAAPFTLECWVQPGAENFDQTLVSVGDKDGLVDNWRLELDDTDDSVDFTATDTSSGTATATINFGTSGWYHCIGLESASNSRTVYANYTTTGSNTTSLTPDNADSTYVGLEVDSSATIDYYGDIDEVRISNTNRADAWIKFTYYNIANADHEIAFDVEESNVSGQVIMVAGE